MEYRQGHSAAAQVRTDRSKLAQAGLRRLSALFLSGRFCHGVVRAPEGDANALASRDSSDDGHAAMDTGKMNAKISWIRLLISGAGVAGAAFFFWKASQVGLS